MDILQPLAQIQYKLIKEKRRKSAHRACEAAHTVAGGTVYCIFMLAGASPKIKGPAGLFWLRRPPLKARS